MPADPNPNDGFWTDAKGRLVPDRLVSDADKLEDETVRLIHRHGVELMARIARYRDHSFDDMGALMALLAERYGATRGGAKGNRSFTSYDGRIKVEVRIADDIALGPELQVAKALIDEYVEEVSEGVPDAVRALLEHAFEVGKAGRVDRARLHGLRRLKVDHPKWRAAMEAVADSMRVVGAREHFRISVRDSAEQPFRTLPLTLSGAYEPRAEDAA